MRHGAKDFSQLRPDFRQLPAGHSASFFRCRPHFLGFSGRPSLLTGFDRGYEKCKATGATWTLRVNRTDLCFSPSRSVANVLIRLRINDLHGD
jgi:hypothetical protein